MSIGGKQSSRKTYASALTEADRPGSDEDGSCEHARRAISSQRDAELGSQRRRVGRCTAAPPFQQEGTVGARHDGAQEQIAVRQRAGVGTDRRAAGSIERPQHGALRRGGGTGSSIVNARQQAQG